MEPTDETAIISDPETNSDNQTAREKFEQARLSRRAALRKMGLTTGMALFGMFAVDDLARMAIKKMEQHKETRQVAETVAKEFKNSGIAFAAPSPSQGCAPGGGAKYPPGKLSGTNIGADCNSDPNYYCDGNGTYAECVSLACANYQYDSMSSCQNDAGPPLTTS